MTHKLRLTIFLVALFSISAVYSFSQEKVIDKSKRKRPDWVHSTQKDFIITTGRGKTIDEAKDNVVTEIQNEIVNSVAIYVKSESEMTIENINKNNVINTIEKFKNKSSVQTADIPSLKGISLNKVSDFYWEKIQNKKTKEITVAYHVKYPYSEAELQKLIREFNKKDQEMTSKLNGIVNNIDDIKSIEEISTNIKELKHLLDYFIDMQRKEKTNMGIARLKEMLKSIELVPIENTLGTLKYAFKIGEKFYSSSKKPKYKNSECVTVTSRISDGHEQIIKYTFEDCMEDEKNYITVKYKFSNTKVEKTFYFDVTSNMVKVFIRGDIIMKEGDSDEDNINSFACDITLVSKYEAAFVVDKVVLKWQNLPPVSISNINKEFSGKGTHNLSLEINQQIDRKKTSSKNKPAVDGTIFFKSKTTGETKRYKFYGQNVETDW